MITLYGIKQCDSVKKALKQLDVAGTQYQFVDLKDVVLDAETIKHWLALYPEKLVNKRSTTYRTVKDQWLAATSQEEQIALIQKNQTLIKRPVMVTESGDVGVGL